MDGERQSGSDERATVAIGRLYAAPTSAGYWQDLEARIMARIAEVDLGWWTEFDRWRRPALAAAAVMLIAAGVTMYRARQTDATRSYQELVAPAAADAAPSDPGLQNPREATLRAVLIARN